MTPAQQLKKITSFMLKDEKIINWYNKKYNFDITTAPVKDQKEYAARLASWDMWKSKRDNLKQVAA
jgi:hypothetical protein